MGEGGVVRLVWDGARSNLRSERFIRKREQIGALDTVYVCAYVCIRQSVPMFAASTLLLSSSSSSSLRQHVAHLDKVVVAAANF